MDKSDDKPLEGSQFMFDPAKIDVKEFLDSQDNPGKEFSRRVISDVIADLKKDFEQNQVPKEVLELIEQTWINKLKIRSAVDLEPVPVEPTSSMKTKEDIKKVMQFDGLNDSTSSSSSDEVEVIDQSDTSVVEKSDDKETSTNVKINGEDAGNAVPVNAEVNAFGKID